jgi:heat shock protein HslJ
MKIRLIVLTALVGMFLLLMTACGENANKDPLDGTSWTLFAYRKSKPIEDTTLTIAFEDGQISGSAGCNSYFGSYEIKSDIITISETGWTLMACLDPEGVMEQEQLFMEYLQDAQRFTLNDEQLMIFQSEGEALTFIPN